MTKFFYFLLRHPITCITLSDSGKYLATGETASLGTRAMVVCWDTSTWAQVGSHQTHHAKVQYLAISPDDGKVWNPLKYLRPSSDLILPSWYPLVVRMTRA